MELRDKSILDLYINGEPAIDSLKKLDTEIDSLKKQQKQLKKDLEMTDLDESKRSELINSYREVSDKIKDCTTAKQMLRREMDMEELSIKELKQLLKDYRKEWEAATDPAIREAMKGKIDDVNQRLNELGVNVKKQEGMWSSFKGWVTAAFTAEGIMAMLSAVVDFARESLKIASELTDSFADIRKATGMTTEEVEGLSDAVSKIDTRTAQQSLLDIAKVGGQIGIAKDEMLGFVESVDKAVVALGDEFQGGAEEVASKMGTLKQLFSDTKDLDAGTAINKIGSAINELGAAGSATGPVMADFATRMGQLGNLAPQINQTLGLGAAFQELGLTAEIAAGGLSNILLGAAKATDLFAQHLGMTESAFKSLINTNPNEVILKLAESFKGLPTDVVVKQLDALGIKSQEATKVMSLLSDQTVVVRQKQELASKAMEEATSLTNEFNIKNNTAAAELEKAEKGVNALRIQLGTALLPVVVNIITSLVSFVNVIRAIPAFVSENKEMFIALGAAILSFNSHLIAATAASLAHAAVEKARLIWTESATVAQWAMNTALTANPIGAIVAAIALLVGGLVTLWKNSDTVRGIVLGLWEAMKVGVTIATEVASSIWKGIQDLIDKFPLLTNTIQLVWTGAKVAFDSLISILGSAGEKIGWLVDKASGIGSSISSSLEPGINYISSGFSYVKNTVGDFIALVQTVGNKVATALKAITPDSFLEAASIFSGAGKRISQAFNSAFGDEQTKGHKEQSEADEAHNAKKVIEKKKVAGQIGLDDQTANKDTNSKNQSANDEHRSAELKREQEAIKKRNEERHKAEKEALKAIEDMAIKSIADEQEREIAKLELSLKRELARVEESKASTTTKTMWEKALNEQFERDVAKVQDDFRKKHLAENEDLTKRINKLKTDQITDELEKKKVQLLTELNTELEKNKTLKGDAELKAQYEEQLRVNYKNNVEKLEEEYRAKNIAEEKKRLDELKSLEDKQRDQLHAAEREAMRTTLQTKLQDETLNINQRRNLKAELIKLEYDMEMEKIEKIAAREKQEAQATSDKLMALAKDDAAKKNQIANQLDQQIRAIDTKLEADKRANDAKYQADLKKAELDSLAERKEKHTKFMDALKGLMTGDYQGFVGFLNNKFKNEKAMNDARLQNWTSKGEQILEVVEVGLQLMQKLEKARLDKQLANIAKEKNTQLASWKEQYEKGLISKDQYESKVDQINKEFGEKEKAEKLKSWKREQNMQIAMAIIHAAMAALKSLATMGFPLGLIGVAASAAAAAVQIALIKRQQPPSFAGGGLLKNGGVPDGPRHGSRYGDSGIALVRRDTQQEIGEMEGGEPIMVLSRNTYANNRRVVDKLLHSSLHRNGAPIYAEKGAMLAEGGYANERPSYNDNNEFNPGGDSYNQQNYSQSQNNSSGSDSFDAGYSEGSYDGGSGGSYDGGGDTGNYDTSDAEATTSLTNEEIAKSQALMENIGKYTERTALGVERGFLENTESTAIRLDRLSENMVQSFAQLNDTITRLLGVATEHVGVSKDIASTSRITSDKNFAISVTTINDINNTINVFVDKSSFS
jgi:TP901 family phage tail tape measure protein